MFNLLNSRAKILLIATGVILLIAVPLTVIQVQKQQEIRQRAASNSVSFDVVPAFGGAAIKPNDQFSVDINFINTDHPKKISAFEIPITYNANALDYISFTAPNNLSTAKVRKISDGSLRYIWLQDPDNLINLNSSIIKLATLQFTAKADSLGKSVAIDFLNPLATDIDNPTSALSVVGNMRAGDIITSGAAAPQTAPQTAAPAAQTPSSPPTAIIQQLGIDPNLVDQIWVSTKQGATRGIWDRTAPAPTNSIDNNFTIGEGEKVNIKVSQSASVNVGGITYNSNDAKWINIDSWPAVPAPQQTWSCTRKNHSTSTPINNPTCNGEPSTTTNYCSWTNDTTNGCIVSYITTCTSSTVGECNPSVPIPTPTPTPGPPQPRTGGGQPSGQQPGQPPFATPLPTVAPGTTRFTLAVTLENIGVIPGSPKNLERRATIKVDRVGSPQSPFSITKTVALAYNFDQTNQAGKFGGILDLQTLLPTGNFRILVQIPGYLQRTQTLGDHTQVSGPSAASGENIPINISIPLSTGDINGDNAVNALDYGIIQSCFGARASTRSCTFKTPSGAPFADINDDGFVNGVDFILYLKNFGKSGDQ